MTDGEYFLHAFLLLCLELFTDSPGLCFGARLFLGMKTFDKDMRCYRHFIAFRLVLPFHRGWEKRAFV